MKDEMTALRQKFDGHAPGLLGARHEYAVLCPLVERPDGTHLLFEVRSSGIRQGGEVCFPGGRREAGETVAECALRETEEELAIPRREVTLLGTPDFICNQRGFLLRPVLGAVSPEGMACLRPSEAEVAEVFTAPLSFFRDTAPEVYTYALSPQIPEDFPYASIGVTAPYPWAGGQVEVPIWHWQGHTVWGMTARLVWQLVQALPGAGGA